MDKARLLGITNTAIANTIALLYIARHLGPTILGAFAFVLSFMGLVAFFGDMGYAHAFSKAVEKGHRFSECYSAYRSAKLRLALLLIMVSDGIIMLYQFFLAPDDPMQKRYEALRASFVDEQSAEQVANQFGYSVHTINALRRDFKSGSLPPFFRPLTKGPKQRRPSTVEAKDRIIELRKQNYSIDEIEEVLLREKCDIAAKTIHQVLREEGFARLFRRTHAERRIALQQAKDPAEIASVSYFSDHDFVKTAYGGIFLFIPLIVDLKLDTIFNQLGFYGSKQIPRLNYLMSFLALKLIGKERLSHVDDLNFDYGLGTFAGLNVLPKIAAITQYSYRNPHNLVVHFLKKWNTVLKEKGYLQGRYINLDFHSTPHWGEESQLQNH